MAKRQAATRGTQRTLSDRSARALAITIDGSRKQFADAFRLAQTGRPGVLEFEAVVSGTPNYTDAFAKAFTRASVDGWLDALCAACFRAQIVSGDFTRVAAKAAKDPSIAQLQQIVDAHRGFTDGGLLVKRLPRALDQVCRVEVDGLPKGTGFLIRADLVMTAYHVVSSLLQANDTPLPKSAGRLRVRFGYMRREADDGTVTLVDGEVYRVADDWMLKLSPCTTEERLNRLPKDPDSFDGFWDFVVIQLAETAGGARTGLLVADQHVAKGNRLTIIQHPGGLPVAVDSSVVRGFLGKKDRFRIVHEVNAEEGSSGSPCLNDHFEVVGLHQAAMPPSQPAVAGNGNKANRAVPMQRILAFWDPKTAPVPTLAVGRVISVATAVEPQHPVFGRSRLQEWVARSSAMAVGDVPDRFLVVGGGAGAGKSFTTNILRGMLPPNGHVLLECRASEFNSEATAVGFATKYLLDPLGADPTQLPSLAQANTSDNAWLNYQFIGDLLALIDKSRKNRMVWIVLDELDDVVLPDQGQVRKLLDLMYSRAPQNPWIRFVLLGLEGVPVPDLLAVTERDFPAPTTAEELAADVYDYLLRRLENQERPSADQVVAVLLQSTIDAAVRDWVAKCNGKLDHPLLLPTAASSIMFIEKRFGLRK